jgi:hypothetical protein
MPSSGTNINSSYYRYGEHSMSDKPFTYVPARAEPLHPAPPPELAAIAGGSSGGPRQPLDVIQSAIPSYDGVQETTNARDRAIATTLRIVLLAALLFIAGWLLLQLAAPPGLVIIGGIVCLLIGSFVLTRLDYHYSAPGIAHHAIDAAADLAAEQMQLNHALRQQALDAYLKHLEDRHD